MKEIYKNYLNDYEVSNLGNVKRGEAGNYKELKCSINNKGYRYFQQRRDGKRINHLIHHIVAKLFIGERPENQVIDHIDRNKLNNRVENLRYCSQLDNMKNTDKYKHEILEQDPKKRRSLVCKLYVEQNKEHLSSLKKTYYQEHKKHLQEYSKTLFELKCDECNKSRLITRCTLNRAKRLGGNVCIQCQSVKNLGEYLGTKNVDL